MQAFPRLTKISGRAPAIAICVFFFFFFFLLQKNTEVAKRNPEKAARFSRSRLLGKVLLPLLLPLLLLQLVF